MTFYWDCGLTYVKVAICQNGIFEVIWRWSTFYFSRSVVLEQRWKEMLARYEIKAEQHLFLVTSVVAEAKKTIVFLGKLMSADVLFVKRDLWVNYADLYPSEMASDLLCALVISVDQKQKTTLVGCGSMNWIMNVEQAKLKSVFFTLGFGKQALVVQKLFCFSQPILWEKGTFNELSTMNALNYGHLNAYGAFVHSVLDEFKPDKFLLTGGNAFLLQKVISDVYTYNPMLIFAGLHKLAFAYDELPFYVEKSSFACCVLDGWRKREL